MKDSLDIRRSFWRSNRAPIVCWPGRAGRSDAFLTPCKGHSPRLPWSAGRAVRPSPSTCYPSVYILTRSNYAGAAGVYCFDGPSLIYTLTLEPNLVTVCDGNKAVALVVNNLMVPNGSAKGYCSLTSWLMVCKSPEPLDLHLSSPIGAVTDVQLGRKNPQWKVDNHVKVIDYPELCFHFLERLNKYRDTK